jgi:UDP-N-acetylmuramoyl-L-alanyl-D-glutamate--2,6-diaminopimelate ligase
MRHFFSGLVPQSIKNIFWHFPQAVLAACWYRFPARKLRVIGITGTNGKTTTTTLIGRMLEAAGKKVVVASTIAVRINGEERVNATKFTTASPWHVQSLLHQAVAQGCEYAVLEVSSHALDQYRVWGIHFEVAVITNITREHLDYHHTMDRYTEAKRRLFCNADIGVVNADMVGPEVFCLTVHKPVTFSTKNPEATVIASNIALDFKGSTFQALNHFFELHLPGFFNVENALAMLATGSALGLSPDAMQRALRETTGIPGRMELVPNAQGIDIVIDYAVTPDAFEKLYTTVLALKIPGTKIIHVFGACGDRDRGKRPVMGKIASEKADIIILTNEDPYYEDPERIINEIESGIVRKQTSENYYRIFDRREAIRKALELAEQGDIVLITGKGAEETMAIGKKRISWKERQVIEEELTKISELPRQK